MITGELDKEFLQGLTVLYVEDEEIIHKQGARLLAKMCGTLISAHNGREGLELYHAHVPDIIITDVNMPFMDGLAMAEHIHRSDRDVPIIVVTAFEHSDYLKRAIEAGIDHYIMKPATRAQLFDKLVECAHRLRLEWDVTQKNIQLKKLSRVVEQSPAAIVITDAEGTIEFINESFAKLTGYSVAEAVGENPRILKSDNVPAQVYADMWNTLRAGNIWSGELQNRCKDGSLVWEHATISPLFDETGTVTNYIGVKENITEKKQLVQQLMHAQKVETIGQLACGLAHDLNNILTVVNGYGTLIKMSTNLSPLQHQQIKEIMAASAQASALTHSMLAYGRKQIMKQMVQDLVPVVSKISGFIKRLIREDIGLVFSLPDDALLVNVDAGQIEQVMLNLTTNARDAMPQSGTLSVSVRRGVMGALGMPDGDTPCAIISVADTGCGMNPETRERIFDPFFTTKEFGKGSGLGLAMVFGIVAQHGGYINVQSELGAGSVFHVYLPLVVEEGVPLLLADGDEYAFSISQYGETILVVEDEKSTRLLLVEVLKKAGYSVIEAANGTDALEKFKAGGGNIRLVISDVVMPNMGGKKLYDEIRALSESVPFIFMSGHGSDVIHVGGTLDATIDLLEKPLMPLALLAKVQQLLD